jgi:MauM/NapG family ferredoxin protein
VFLFLQTESRGADELGWPVRFFLDFDPLILITTLLSAHKAPVAFYLSLIVIALTLVFGRFFCGWVCPLGTLHNLVSLFRRSASQVFKLNWLKYLVLVFLLVSSLFTLHLVGFIDPISLLIRSLSLSVYPLFVRAVISVFDITYTSGPDAVVNVSESVYGILKDTVLPFHEPHFRQSVFIGLLFLGILGLNLFERRFWCRHLCPLGALLALLSRHAFVSRRVSQACNACGACVDVCPGGTNPHMPALYRVEECYACNNCDDVCPQGAVFFGRRRGADPLELNLGRRRIVTATVAGIIAVPLLRISPSELRAEPLLIRPPGALPEKDFLRTCVRCGECMKVCITGGLQPTLLEAGVEGLWTPLLVPRIGYCEYRCTLCGQVCPTGAIKELSIEEKTKVKIGLAMVDKGRCLPWAHGVPCIVCEEVCPTPKKAVWFREETFTLRDGSTVELQKPMVDLELCIGCGICETLCPVADRPAIYVTSTGESRSEDNQLLI